MVWVPRLIDRIHHDGLDRVLLDGRPCGDRQLLERMAGLPGGELMVPMRTAAGVLGQADRAELHFFGHLGL